MSSSGSEDEGSLPSAQPRVDIIPETQEDLRYDTEAESSQNTDNEEYKEDTDDGYLSDPPDPERPNRLDPTAFYKQFADERELSQSLDSIHARDLAVHLYNAFQLRERARRLRARSNENAWEPPRSWTAWPVPAKYVPRDREEEKLTKDHAWTLCGKPDANSTEALEDNLIAVAARRAREKYANRPSTADSEASSNISPTIKPLDHDSTDDINGSGSQSPAWTAEIITKPPELPASKSRERLKRENSSDARTEFSSNDSSDDEEGVTTAKALVTKHKSTVDSQVAPDTPVSPHAGPAQTFLVEEADLYPHPLSDEGHIKKLLGRPTRHTLLKFEHLLAAMHHSRASHVGRTFRKPPPVSSSRASTRSVIEARKMSKRYVYRNRLQKYTPWDWSNVLGFAAIAEWDDEIIQRVRQRCERLFGQRMDFVTSTRGQSTECTEAIPGSSTVPSTQPTNIQDVELGLTAPATSTPAAEPGGYPRADNNEQIMEASDSRDAPSHSTENPGSDPAEKDRPALEVRDGLHVDGFLQPLYISQSWKRKRKVHLPHWHKQPAPMETWESSSDTATGSGTDIEDEGSSAVPVPNDHDMEKRDVTMPDANPDTLIDPALLAIDPQLLDPRLHATDFATASASASAKATAGKPSSMTTTPHAVRDAAGEDEGEEPATMTAGPSSTNANPNTTTTQSPQPPQQQSESEQHTDKKRAPRRPRKQVPVEQRRPRGRPPKPKPPEPAGPKVRKKRVGRKKQGPQAPKLLRPLKYERTPEEIEAWRAKGFVERTTK